MTQFREAVSGELILRFSLRHLGDVRELLILKVKGAWRRFQWIQTSLLRCGGLRGGLQRNRRPKVRRAAGALPRNLARQDLTEEPEGGHTGTYSVAACYGRGPGLINGGIHDAISGEIENWS